MRKKREIKVKRPPYYCKTRQSWVIPLTQGRETLVDADDAEVFGKRNWCWIPDKNSVGYVVAPGNGSIYLHRLITNAPNGMVVDHINGNQLDNRKSNLRICTNRENQQNRYTHRSGRLVGSSFHKRSGKWQCVMMIDGKLTHKGLFKTELEAHEAYKEALKELAGN